MNNFTNEVAYLRTTRQFPPEVNQLAIQIERGYLDIATAVNNRIIGIFTTNFPSVTGESWYVSNNRKQQTLRKVFTFTSTASITHGITVVDIAQFVRCWGSFTDGTNSYGIPWSTTMMSAGIITFYITPTTIEFVVGGGSPTLTSGTIVLEYLSQV